MNEIATPDSEGSDVGEFEGWPVIILVGSPVGESDERVEGCLEGCAVGDSVGASVDGTKSRVGAFVGPADGLLDGLDLR